MIEIIISENDDNDGRPLNMIRKHLIFVQICQSEKFVKKFVIFQTYLNIEAEPAL